MEKGYFHRINEQTNNRFWINNPTPSEAEKAIKAGAISCTTNPTFVSKQMAAESEHDYCLQIVDEVIKETKDDKEAAALIQRKIVKRILDKFLPLYEKKPGHAGFVSIQGDPYAEDNPDSIIKEVSYTKVEVSDIIDDRLRIRGIPRTRPRIVEITELSRVNQIKWFTAKARIT